MRGKKRELKQTACANCGNFPFLANRLSVADPEFHQAANWLGIGGIIATILSLYGLYEGKLGNLPILAVGVWFIVFWMRHNHFSGKNQASRQKSRQAAFFTVSYQINSLKLHRDHLKEVLASERSELPSVRGSQRIELMEAALESREKRIAQLEGELWARDVQLWLNQLEGFVAERLPKLTRLSGAETLGMFRNLMLNGRHLATKGDALVVLEEIPRRALKLLKECLERSPELEDRVKDARVLAAIGEGPELPEELNAGGTWLHWLQNAIPSLDLMPVEFTEDEEYLRLQTELRLLRDGAKYAAPVTILSPNQSLDTPTIVPRNPLSEH